MLNPKLGYLTCLLGLTIATPAHAEPAWCKTMSEGKYNLKQALTADDVDHALPAIAEMLCHPNEEATAQRAAIEARRQDWMKRLEMTEADWASDVVEWANEPYSTRNHVVPKAVDGLAWSAMGPIDQHAYLMKNTGWSGAFIMQPGAQHYIADALPLSEIGRLAYLEQCVQVASESDMKPVEWATCQSDLEAFDAKKLAAELRAETSRSAYDRMTIRVALGAFRAQLPDHAARVKKLLARDPVYAKLFELGKATTKSWNDNAKARADVLALVLAMDDARVTQSRKASAGCSDKTWAAFAAAISNVPAKRFENMRGDRDKRLSFLDDALGVVLDSPDVYLAANALISCEGNHDYLLGKLVRALAYWPGMRGPRTATISAIRAASFELDDRTARLGIPDFHLPLAGNAGKPERGTSPPISLIASVTDQGDHVLITFPKKTGTQTVCASSRTTNRISRIDEHGNVYYATECTKYATEKFDATIAPVTVAKRYAAGLKAGRYVSVVGSFVEVVWAKADSPTPLAAFGVQLK